MFTLAINLRDFCNEGAEILQLVGWILTALKIAIPLLVIAFGIFDFGKAVTAAKPEEINKTVKSLLYRAIAGLVIFFIPTLVMLVFGAISGYREIDKKDFERCEACVLRPWSETREGGKVGCGLSD